MTMIEGNKFRMAYLCLRPHIRPPGWPVERLAQRLDAQRVLSATHRRGPWRDAWGRLHLAGNSVPSVAVLKKERHVSVSWEEASSRAHEKEIQGWILPYHTRR